jgi:hypothetical protein
MPVNVPTFTSSNFSFGPGRLFLGAAGTTPSVDVGGITEEGISVTLMNKKKDITQGNPKIPVYTFSQEQGVTLKLSGIEWNVTTLLYGLGSGNTTSVSSQDTLSFGGDPLVEAVALWAQHYMAVAGHTLNMYVWRAVSDGDIEMALNHDEHKFPYQWKAQRSTTNWAGATLAFDEQLIQIYRQKT